MIRILGYEDRQAMRESIEMLLKKEAKFELIQIYSNCNNAVEEVEIHKPDVIIMDIDLPGINGIEGVKMIKEKFADIQVIMLTVFEDDNKIFESIKAGASSYILKKNIPDDLVAAIFNTSSGGSSMSPGIASKVLGAFRGINVDNPNSTRYLLSKREQEVLDYLTKGYTYKMIAADMFVSVETVRSHIKNIYFKLQVNSATEAVARALKDKIV